MNSILIVGAGPVGVALACRLRTYGLNCRIIEKRLALTEHSKAINVNSASLNLLDKIGVIDRFLASGQKVGHVYAHWEKKRIMHVNYARLDAPYPFFLSLPQAKTEQILAGYLTDCGGSIERGIELVEVAVEEKGVSIVLKHQDGTLEKGHYDYLLACDGGKSTVRNRLNLPFEGHDHDKHFLLFDGFVDWNGAVDDTHYFVNEKGYFVMAPMVGGYHRMVLHDDSSGKLSHSFEDYKRLIEQFGPSGLELKKIICESSGHFYNRLVENYMYKNRVFFVGDSAHIFSPLGGLGLNTGLQDMHNLAWKLAGVIKYGWPKAILETYDQERRLIAQQSIKTTDLSTRLICRTEKELHPNVINWLPLLRNRHLMRSIYPRQFSGLGAQYPKSAFIQEFTDKQSTGVGGFLPYIDDLNINKGGTKNPLPVFIIFGKEERPSAAVMEFYGFETYYTDSLKLKVVCNLKDGDILLLRPDGIVGFKGHQSAPNILQNYLKSWYSKCHC